MKQLVLSYELGWRTQRDETFMKSQAWKDVRFRTLRRGNFTCLYCGFHAEKGMHVNHIDGNPKNNQDDNLEVICPECHMIKHSGLWCAVRNVIVLFRNSKYNQNDIIRIAREMRANGKKDKEIIQCLGLRNQVPWKQDLKYLSSLYGFISSKVTDSPMDMPKPHMTEEEQHRSLAERSQW